MSNPTRRSLSGIYIFDTLPGDEKRQPTCFEDCTEETQNKWLDSLEPEALKNLSIKLASCLREIGDMFDIVSGSSEDNSE